MKAYNLIIKSHADWPDWDYTLDAETREEAIEEFYKLLHGEYDREYIDSQLAEETN